MEYTQGIQIMGIQGNHNMKTKIIVKGPVLSRSGYGEQSRFALRALRSREDIFDIYILPVGWGQTGWCSDDTEERRWMDQCIARTNQYMQQKGQFDISCQITIPNEWEKIAPINIGYTAGIETTKVAPVWLQKANEMDKVIVVSNHSKQIFENSAYEGQHPQTGQKVALRCETPIEVVNYPVRHFDKEPIDLNLDYDFNFLCMCQWGPRKNLGNTISWFIEENFDQEVGLIIKTNIKNHSIIDREHAEAAIRGYLTEDKDRKCKVYLLHGDMNEEEMTALYRNPKIKAMISTTHGEGFGLPLFEAAYNGMPVVAPGWSGQNDFLYMPDSRRNSSKKRPMFASIEYDIKPVQKEAVWEGVIQADSMWCFPKEASFKRRLREVRTQYPRFKKNAKKLQKWILKEFTEEKKYNQFCNGIIGKSSLKPQEIEGISFCVPTNGKRPDKTTKLIESIKSQMSIPYEIILCGDISAFADIDGIKLIDMKTEAHSRKVASLRNRAAENASYDTIVWSDDDIFLSPSWLQKTLEHSKKYGWKVLGNKILNPDGTRHWDRGLINPRVLVDYSHPSYSKNILQTSGFFLARKEVFEKVKWNEDRLVFADRMERQMPEDLQYSIDLIQAGYQLDFNQESLVWHNDESYTEWGNQTVLKDVIKQQTGMGFFPGPCDEFLGQV